MDPTQREKLLIFARQVLRAQLTGQPLPPPPAGCEEAEDFGGAFVTLKNAGRLRGCIGRFHPPTGLCETVREMAIEALKDWRFHDNPVTLDELDALTIEISILSPMRRTDDPLSLQVGVHGIYICKGKRNGCFLPQVATEQRWTREQFLSYCCAGKAGLPSDAWKEPETEVYLFTAEVFGQQDFEDGSRRV